MCVMDSSAEARVSLFLRKITDIVLRARIGEPAHVDLAGQVPAHYTLDILGGSTVLERWSMTVEASSPFSSTPFSPPNSRRSPAADDSDLILLVQSLYSHVRLLPLHSFLDSLSVPVHFWSVFFFLIH